MRLPSQLLQLLIPPNCPPSLPELVFFFVPDGSATGIFDLKTVCFSLWVCLTASGLGIHEVDLETAV